MYLRHAMLGYSLKGRRGHYLNHEGSFGHGRKREI